MCNGFRIAIFNSQSVLFGKKFIVTLKISGENKSNKWFAATDFSVE